MSVNYTYIDKPSIISISTSKELVTHVQNTIIVIVKCHTEWCGPCKILDPLYKKLAKKYQNNDNIIFLQDDVDNDESPHASKVSAVPVTFVYYKGEIIEQNPGADIEPVKNLIESFFKQLN